MNDFTRPFTEEEFNKVFRDAGYPEIARQYCREKYDYEFSEALHDLSNCESKDINLLLTELKKECCWKMETMREEAWNNVLKHAKVDIYMEQLKHGNSHEWAALFCNLCEDYDNDEDARNNTDIYASTYYAHRKLHKDDEGFIDKTGLYICTKPGIMSDPQIHAVVKYFSKGEGEFVEQYIGRSIFEGDGRNINDLLEEALFYRKQCYALVAEGFDLKTAMEHVDNLSTLEESVVFHDIYREAMKHNAAPSSAYRLARLCENEVVNGTLGLDNHTFKKEFTEPWQREIYAGLLVKDMLKSEGAISVLHENAIRKDLDLKPVDKSLTWEDEEFLRLKNEYIESGLDESTAKQRAYKEVYENDSDITIGGINHKHANDFNREMLGMMFPDEDIESEDFEDGLDMEDMYD